MSIPIRSELARVMSLFQATMMGVGMMIGAGRSLLPASVSALPALAGFSSRWLSTGPFQPRAEK